MNSKFLPVACISEILKDYLPIIKIWCVLVCFNLVQFLPAKIILNSLVILSDFCWAAFHGQGKVYVYIIHERNKTMERGREGGRERDSYILL